MQGVGWGGAIVVNSGGEGDGHNIGVDGGVVMVVVDASGGVVVLSTQVVGLW